MNAYAIAKNPACLNLFKELAGSLNQFEIKFYP